MLAIHLLENRPRRTTQAAISLRKFDPPSQAAQLMQAGWKWKVRSETDTNANRTRDCLNENPPVVSGGTGAGASRQITLKRIDKRMEDFGRHSVPWLPVRQEYSSSHNGNRETALRTRRDLPHRAAPPLIECVRRVRCAGTALARQYFKRDPRENNCACPY